MRRESHHVLEDSRERPYKEQGLWVVVCVRVLVCVRARVDRWASPVAWAGVGAFICACGWGVTVRRFPIRFVCVRELYSCMLVCSCGAQGISGKVGQVCTHLSVAFG